VAYYAELRASEVLKLKMHFIDNKINMIHIKVTKY